MRKTLVLLNVFIALFFAGCVGKKFTTQNFDTKTAGHKVIAILPFEMVYTGKQPSYLTAGELETIKKAESGAFQKGLYQNLLSMVGTGKKDIKIEIQPVEKTNRLLQENGINLLALNGITTQEICKKLGVDAVVYSKIEKERLLSDLDTFGAPLPQELVEKLRVNNPVLNEAVPTIPGNVSRTFNIKADSRLNDAQDGSLLWQFDIETDADWKASGGNIITIITRQSAKKFPYRNRKQA